MPRAHPQRLAPRATATKPARLLRPAPKRIGPAEKPTQERPISGTFRSILDPGFRRGDEGGNPMRARSCRRFLGAALGPGDGAGPGAEMGRRRRGVDRESPQSVRKSSRSASRLRRHTIPSFRYSSADAGGVARGQAARSPVPRAHPQRLAPRATTTKPARLPPSPKGGSAPTAAPCRRRPSSAPAP